MRQQHCRLYPAMSEHRWATRSNCWNLDSTSDDCSKKSSNCWQSTCVPGRMGNLMAISLLTRGEIRVNSLGITTHLFIILMLFIYTENYETRRITRAETLRRMNGICFWSLLQWVFKLWSSAVWPSTRAWRYMKYVLRTIGINLQAYMVRPWRWRQHFLSNVATHLEDYTVSQSRRPQFEERKISNFSWIRRFTRSGQGTFNTQKRLCHLLTQVPRSRIFLPWRWRR
jgi:hypothetical protein